MSNIFFLVLNTLDVYGGSKLLKLRKTLEIGYVKKIKSFYTLILIMSLSITFVFHFGYILSVFIVLWVYYKI